MHGNKVISSETTAKGAGLAELGGKLNPAKLDSSPTRWKNIRGVV